MVISVIPSHTSSRSSCVIPVWTTRLSPASSDCQTEREGSFEPEPVALFVSLHVVRSTFHPDGKAVNVSILTAEPAMNVGPS